MSRVHTNQKFLKMIKLLRSMKTPHISRLMALRGFRSADYDMGWDLLRKAVGPDLAEPGPLSLFTGSSKELIENIDQWENVYFDIADATLRHQYPALHERLFLNLTKSSGAQVILNVETFLRRLGEFEQEGGEEIDAAMALMDQRGLTRSRRDDAQVQVGEATSLELTEPPPVSNNEQEERLQSEEDMWKWFKDWAQIARTIVKDKRIRIYMGISARASSSDDDEPEVTDDPVPPMPAPVPIVSPDGPSTPVRA